MVKSHSTHTGHTGGARVGHPRAFWGLRIIVLGGWLALAVIACAAALAISGGTVSAASAVAQDCVATATGTPQPTPPLEQPTAYPGAGGAGQLPCATITPTVSSPPPPLPGGFGGGGGIGTGGGTGSGTLPGGSLPGGSSINPASPTGPNGPGNSGGSNGPNGSSSGGSQSACSGPLCWVSQAAGGVAQWWNSQSSFVQEGIKAAVIILAITGVAVLITFALPEVIAGVAASAIASGGISAAFSAFVDLAINHSSIKDAMIDAGVQFVIGAVSVLAALKLANFLKVGGRLLKLDKFLPDGLLEDMSAAIAKGRGIPKRAWWLAQPIAGVAVVWAATGVEALNAVTGSHLPLPPPNLENTITTSAIVFTALLLHADVVSKDPVVMLRQTAHEAVREGGLGLVATVGEKIVGFLFHHGSAHASRAVSSHAASSHAQSNLRAKQ